MWNKIDNHGPYISPNPPQKSFILDYPLVINRDLYPSIAMPHYQRNFILQWTFAVASTPVSRRMVPRDSDEERSWPELLRRNVGPALIDAKTVLVPIILGADAMAIEIEEKH